MPVSAMTMAAPYQRLGEDGYAFRTLCVLMTILVAILPLAHVTGMRNALVGMAAARRAVPLPGSTVEGQSSPVA